MMLRAHNILGLLLGVLLGALLGALLGVSSALAQTSPDWGVDPAAFEFSMSFVINAQLLGASSTQPGDRVAAFAGDPAQGDIRGVAAPTVVDGRNLFFLLVYANTDAEIIRFRYFDSLTGDVHEAADGASFSANDVRGTVTTPFVLNVLDQAGSGVQTPPPAEWQINPARFERTMNVVALLAASGLTVASGDRLAAFVGSDIRGVAEPTDVGGRMLFFLTVYANTQQEAVRYVFFDASENAVIPLVQTDDFASDAVIGSVAQPRTLTPASSGGGSGGTDSGSGPTGSPPDWSVDASAFQNTMNVVSRVIVDGVVSTDPGDRLAVFALGAVRGVTAPTSVGNGQLFFLTAYSNATSETLTARLFDASTGNIIDLGPAFSFVPDRVEGTVASPLLWEGANPGNGGGDGGGGGSGDGGGDAGSGLGIMDSPANWTVTPSDFERTMSVLATYSVNDMPAGQPADRLAAFVDGAVRGVTPGTQVGDRVLFFLTLYANTDGEEFVFRALDTSVDEVRVLDGRLDFVSNGVQGTVENPLAMRAAWPGTCVPELTVLPPVGTGPGSGAESGALRVVGQGETVLFEVNASLPPCATETHALSFTWEQTSGPSLAAAGVDLPLATRASLQVPGSALVAGNTYVLEVTAFAEGRPSARRTTEATIVVERAPLAVVVSGGNRTVGEETPFTLSAATSRDPDDNSALNAFTWTCSIVSGTDLAIGGDCGLTLPPESEITLAAGVLPPGVFRFEVTGSKDTREAAASVEVTVEAGSIPAVSIEGEGPTASALLPGAKFEVSDPLELAGSATSDVAGSLTWSWTVTGPGQLDLSDPSISSTGADTPALLLAPNALAEGATYRFELTVRDADGGLGKAAVELTTNAGPQGGTLSAQPVTGTALTTEFAINAAGWVDDDGALSYQFLVRRPDTAPGAVPGAVRLVPLTDRVVRSSVRMVLPRGDAANGDLLTVVVRVFDALGRATSVNVPVTVRPAPPIQQAVLTTDSPNGDQTEEGEPRIELDGDLSVEGQLTLDGLDLDLGGNTVDLGATGSINEQNGQITGAGQVRTARELNGPSEQNIGGIGLGLATGSDLGLTDIQRRHEPATLPDGSESIRRRFVVEPAQQPSAGITITIRFTARDLNGNDPSTLICYVFAEDAGVWTTEGVTVLARTETSVTCQAPHLSEWTLGGPDANMPLRLNARVMLEGPLSGDGTSMRVSPGGIVPLAQPFSADAFAGTSLAWDGSERVISLPADVVDWVLVELRLGTELATIEGRRAGLLLSDGRIVDTDGVSRLAFPGRSATSYFVVVRHRNHVPVISESAVALTNVSGPAGVPFDVSIDDPLLAGDANADGHVRNDDKNDFFFPALGQSGYLPGDFNLDGQITATDRDTFWRRNVGRSAVQGLLP